MALNRSRLKVLALGNNARSRTARVTVVAGLVALGLILPVTGGGNPAPAAPSGAAAGGLAGASAGVADLGVDVSEPVTTGTYDLGPINLPGVPHKVELTGVVHRPKVSLGRRLPVVVMVHGQHAVCLYGVDATVWPCPRDKYFPNYRGYDYVGKNLAAHGVVVISIGANGVNHRSADSDDEAMTARARLIRKHLDLWREWTTRGNGPFGRQVLGAIDYSRVGLMGHSQGGEGVVRAAERDGADLKPYGVKAVLAVAPSGFKRRSVSSIPIAALVGDCDHDVGPGVVKYYDNSRYTKAGDLGPKYQVIIRGANHAFFNTTWSPSGGLGGLDDWFSYDPKVSECAVGKPARLTEKGQREVALAYFSSFFRLHLKGERRFAGIWEGTAKPPRSFGTAEVPISYHAPANRRLDLNRLTVAADLTRNAVGGAASQRGFQSVSLCGGAAPQPRNCLARSDMEGVTAPHQETTGPKPGLGVVAFKWAKPGATFTNRLEGAARNLSAYRELRFRAGVNFTDPLNPVGKPQDFSVVLTDGSGKTSSVRAEQYGKALQYPRLIDRLPGNRDLRIFFFHQQTVPLTDFTGINLNDIRSVDFHFNTTPKGSIAITDLTATR
ncbi:hypothetical protein [Kribbella solani]|uniref:Dienelactone hydrolase n=1 Tax=Kribbella solani TaxID=236067 RepID=A0A841E0C2_9ACTN|nr:hypothetical protein [Kribbella solani]MBB5982465.1 dienelactone hydrolase [Kribbella solani]